MEPVLKNDSSQAFKLHEAYEVKKPSMLNPNQLVQITQTFVTCTPDTVILQRHETGHAIVTSIDLSWETLDALMEACASWKTSQELARQAEQKAQDDILLLAWNLLAEHPAIEVSTSHQDASVWEVTVPSQAIYFQHYATTPQQFLEQVQTCVQCLENANDPS